MKNIDLLALASAVKFDTYESIDCNFSIEFDTLRVYRVIKLFFFSPAVNVQQQQQHHQTQQSQQR